MRLVHIVGGHADEADLSADQAREMVRHMIDGIPSNPASSDLLAVSQFEKSEIDSDIKPARGAPQDVLVGVGNGSKRRSLFVLNPATGALEVAPDHHRAVEKAIRRELRRVYLRIQLRLLKLKLRKLRLSLSGEEG